VGELDLAGRTLGGYRVGELLGRGAFGWVYRATQLSLDRVVALKVLDPVVARNPDAARRFDREGRSAASLDHPAIVDVFDADSAGGLHYLAMRLIDGVALDEVLRRRRLHPGEVAAVLARIAAALHHAHARGVVHRDVKPANILLEHGDPARAWLGDFGIAVSTRIAGALSTATVGTAYYMSPEQLEPNRVGPAADQYSLACVAFEMLTGRRPFGAGSEDVMAVLLAHRADPVPTTGSAALDAVFRVALAKSPADRYPTVRDFAAALDQALRAPASRSSRRPLLVGGLAVVAAAVTVAMLTLPGDPEPAAADPDWTTVRGPGDAEFRVPPGWERTNAGAVVTFAESGDQVLVVGGERAEVDPAENLRALYDCAGEVRTFELTGQAAASCPVSDRHVTVVAGGGTIVRFAFADTVPSADRDEVLATLTIASR